jgi:hypothetical protein
MIARCLGRSRVDIPSDQQLVVPNLVAGEELRLIRCNRPKNCHAPLDDSHPWHGRYVPCRSFQCRGPAAIWSGRGAGRSRGGDVRRLPIFIQTPPPTARTTCIGSPAPRCALGAAPRGGQHAATPSERASTADEPPVPTQCVSRAARSDILARCRRRSC